MKFLKKIIICASLALLLGANFYVKKEFHSPNEHIQISGNHVDSQHKSPPIPIGLIK